jgi:hypothetical protein
MHLNKIPFGHTHPFNKKIKFSSQKDRTESYSKIEQLNLGYDSYRELVDAGAENYWQLYIEQADSQQEKVKREAEKRKAQANWQDALKKIKSKKKKT